MKAVYTECSIVLNGGSPIYGAHRIIIRINDQADGPYLVIRGENGEPDVDETPHDFFLQSDAEIDEFARICKDMLRQAQVAEISGEGGGK